MLSLPTVYTQPSLQTKNTLTPLPLFITHSFITPKIAATKQPNSFLLSAAAMLVRLRLLQDCGCLGHAIMLRRAVMLRQPPAAICTLVMSPAEPITAPHACGSPLSPLADCCRCRRRQKARSWRSGWPQLAFPVDVPDRIDTRSRVCVACQALVGRTCVRRRKSVTIKEGGNAAHSMYAICAASFGRRRVCSTRV